MQSKPLAALLIAACVSLATAAGAQTLEVTGVASDDVLNLRAEPRANAPLTGALAPTARGIEAVRRTDGWVFVKSGQQTGWASARFLRPAVTFDGGKPPSPLQCLGTEPFWSLVVDGNRATYHTPDKEAVASEIEKIEQSRNSTIVWRVRPKAGPVASATVEARQACSDDMSDRVYPFSVRVETRDGALLSGCCDLRR